MEADFLGRGFAFPLSVDPTTGQINMSSNEDSIKQSIFIILNTRKGERVMRPDFGCSIHDYVFSSISYFNLNRMQESVFEALTLWEPRIRDIKIEIVPAEEEGKLEVNVSYVVRSTNNPFNLVYPFYMNEGFVAE